jgi:hypothetical protein
MCRYDTRSVLQSDSEMLSARRLASSRCTGVKRAMSPDGDSDMLNESFQSEKLKLYRSIYIQQCRECGRRESRDLS